MEKVNYLTVASNQLGADFCLSPEYFLATRKAFDFSNGRLLTSIVDVSKNTTANIEDSLILDTGNADRGLLLLDMLGCVDRERISSKRLIPEGAVIVSRLRPYLRQIAFIPRGLSDKLGVKRIVASTEFYVLTPKNQDESIAFLVPWLLSKDVQEIFSEATTGGHHPRFGDDLLSKLTISESWYRLKNEIGAKVSMASDAFIESQLQIQKLVENGQR